MRKVYMGAIVGNNEAAGGHFFERSTLRFFNDRPGNWDAWEIAGRVFIRNARHGRGPGMFNGCTLRGQVREVFDWGASIGQSIPELHGLKPRQIARLVEAGKV